MGHGQARSASAAHGTLACDRQTDGLRGIVEDRQTETEKELGTAARVNVFRVFRDDTCRTTQIKPYHST